MSLREDRKIPRAQRDGGEKKREAGIGKGPYA